MEVIVTEEALQRLELELDFLIKVRQTPKIKALSLGKKLVKKAISLSEQPLMGQEEYYLRGLNQGHRRLIAEGFKIIYLIKNDKVYITNFFNTYRDPNSMEG